MRTVRVLCSPTYQPTFLNFSVYCIMVLGNGCGCMVSTLGGGFVFVEWTNSKGSTVCLMLIPLPVMTGRPSGSIPQNFCTTSVLAIDTSYICETIWTSYTFERLSVGCQLWVFKCRRECILHLQRGIDVCL